MSQHKINRSVQFLPWGGWLGYLVRRATELDLDFLVEELHEFTKFYDSRIFEGCVLTVYATDLLRNIIANHVILVCEKDGVKLGLIAGMIHGHLFNPKFKILSELFWWVKVEHRQSRAGLMLLNAYTEIGKEFDWCIMSVEDKSPINPDSLIKRGYKAKESSFILEKEV